MTDVSRATDYALWRLTQHGDRNSALKQLRKLEESRQVREYVQLKAAIDGHYAAEDEARGGDA